MYIPFTVSSNLRIDIPICGEARAASVLDVLDLGFFRSFITATNRSALLPYHNKFHADHVLEDAFLYYGDDKLDEDEAPALALACMFHDYNHSGGTEPDAKNIERALHGLNFAISMSQASYYEQLLPLAERLIRVTEYSPEKGFTYEPRTKAEQAIRDADLSAVFHAWERRPFFPRSGAEQIAGLYTEIRIRDGKPSYDPDTFLAQNKRFLREATFYTPRGEMLQSCLLDLAFDEIRRSNVW